MTEPRSLVAFGWGDSRDGFGKRHYQGARKSFKSSRCVCSLDCECMYKNVSNCTSHICVVYCMLLIIQNKT